MTNAEWAIAGATLMGPVLAVQAQKWIERVRERQQRKTWVFNTLMATRAARLSNEHVRALNMIDLVFYGGKLFGRSLRTKKEQRVMDAWREYFDHLNTPLPEQAFEAVHIQMLTAREELFVNLLYAIATESSFEFDRVQLKKGMYSPIAHNTLELQHAEMRNRALDLLRGVSALRVETRDSADRGNR